MIENRQSPAGGARSNATFDAEIEDSFPASDPPSNTPVGGTRPSRDHAATDRHDHGADIPHATPTDDRHATETASAMIHGTEQAETDDHTKR